LFPHGRAFVTFSPSRARRWRAVERLDVTPRGHEIVRSDFVFFVFFVFFVVANSVRLRGSVLMP
jgi:hypothetical protein